MKKDEKDAKNTERLKFEIAQEFGLQEADRDVARKKENNKS